MNAFLIQHGIDGSYLTENHSRMWTPFAKDGRKMYLQEAFHIARRIPSSRIVAMSAAGSYSAEELTAAEEFVHLADRWF